MKKLDAPQLVLKVLATHTENHFPARRKVDIKDGKILIQRDLTEVGIANDLVELGLQKTNLVLSYRAFYICLNFRFLPLGLCVFAEYQNIHLRLVICICILRLKVLQPS